MSTPVRDLQAPAMPLLEEFYGDWQAGTLTTEDLRDHFPWLWISHGGYSPRCREIALEVLDALGYVTDSPDVLLPDEFWVYQGRVPGQALSISWTPDQQLAVDYSKAHAAIVARQTGIDPGRVLYRARVGRSDVLMFSRLTVEALIRPDRVLAAPKRPSSVGGAPGWARATTPAAAAAALRRVLMPVIRLAGEPEREEATLRSLLDLYLAHQVEQMSAVVDSIYRNWRHRRGAAA